MPDDVPPLKGMWDVGGTLYTCETECDMTKLVEGARVVYWIGKPKNHAGFYTAVVYKCVKSDGNHWLTFDIDKKKAKVPDLTEDFYMKTWAFVKIAQESQEEVPSTDLEGAEAATK